MSQFDKLARDLLKALRESNAKKTTAYDTPATVTRVEDGVAWVHIPGGIDETPVKLTVNAKAGDTIQLRVGNGTAWIVGNATAPPTDDTTANYAVRQNIETNKFVSIVHGIAQVAKKIAGDTAQHFWVTEEGTDTGVHITEIPQEDFLADPDNGGGNLLARSNGIAVRDGLTELATFSADGAQIGMDGQSNAKVDYRSFRMTDREGHEYFNVGDLRDPDGLYEMTDTFTSMGIGVPRYNLSYAATSTDYTITVEDLDGNDVTSSYNVLEKTVDRFRFDLPAPARGYTVIAVYETADSRAKRMTFGYDENGDPTFRVEWNGDLKIAGELSCALHKGGGFISTSTVGDFVSNDVYIQGHMLFAKIIVKNPGTIAAGGNIFQGQIPFMFCPISAATGGSYFGTHSIGGIVDTSRNIIIRNASPNALTLGQDDTVVISFAYMIA